MTATDDSRAQVQLAAIAAIGAGAEDLVALDVSQPLPFADAFLIMSGRSERNVSAIADAVEDKLSEAGPRVKRREGQAEGRWALIDFGDLVVHVFHPEERDYYSLERLWKDCPVIPLEEALVR
ncbi:ribosome silencing factor [Paramicrobacterium chengjingii]|uniref:Ribosomal silencing factor RsfS n=1 Tax=Paramicrobacterium chengjingii TaxID=2769067 RepID=A0ABX6YF49_9MICO|nr:ribosome silencing factor [Microbacterium chengjingii]QPZ37022.1 ribosome silencing factor [Microbacterium chengjingii]